MGWLSEARRRKGWRQRQAAARLGVSQGYLSLLENNRRPVSKRLLPKLQRQFGVPATELPVEAPKKQVDAQRLGGALGALGYSGFAYLKHGKRLNPAQVLLTALKTPNLETRLTEALPWVVLRYPDLNWEWLLEQVKVNDLQNRLGFVLMLAREVAERGGGHAAASKVAVLVHRVERARLVREDTLCRESMTAAERRWLRNQRPAEAQHWNLLTDLAPEQLPPYAT